jgi:hypothetical protein
VDNLLTTDACTMPSAERPLRLAEFDDLFTSSLTRLTADETGVRMHLHGGAGLRDRVRGLTDRETRCCSFFLFSVDGSDAEVVLGITVPLARRDILDALAARAAEVSGITVTAAGAT